MDDETQRALLAINRAFYERFARDFANARSTGQASLRRVLARVADCDAVLDVGCGDGRVARALDEMGRTVSYLGVDASPAFIELAQTRAAGMTRVDARFAIADVSEPGWQRVLRQRRFDVVLLLAVLHHVPGQALRRRVVSDLAVLLAPAGRLVVSTWQFSASERLRRRIVPWSSAPGSAGEAGVDEARLEPGDYLLDWRRGGYGLRYCSLIGEQDIRVLLLSCGLTVEDVYTADGGLNLFAVSRRA